LVQSGGLNAKCTPAVISRLAKDQLFGEENPLGKVIKLDGDEYLEDRRHCLENFKQRGEIQANHPVFFNLRKDGMESILIKVKPGTDANFEAKLMRQLGGMQSDGTMEISYLEQFAQIDESTNSHSFTDFQHRVWFSFCSM